MAESDDISLVREFAETRSEAAFGEIVRRHVNLVFSAALRKTGNSHDAEEITQAVFMLLARKAGSLGPRVVLAGWLYQAARLTASTFLRSARRRVAGKLVVGDSQRSFLFDQGQISYFGLRGDGRICYAKVMNNRGQIAGQTIERDSRWGAFIWKDGRITDLPTSEWTSGKSKCNQ